MLQPQDGHVVGGEILRLLAQARLVPLMTAVAVLALPDRLVEPFDRAEKRFPLDQLGDALAVDRRVAELDRAIEKDRPIRRQLRNFSRSALSAS